MLQLEVEGVQFALLLAPAGEAPNGLLADVVRKLPSLLGQLLLDALSSQLVPVNTDFWHY